MQYDKILELSADDRTFITRANKKYCALLKYMKKRILIGKNELWQGVLWLDDAG